MDKICACGCGKKIPHINEHSRRKYIHGHYTVSIETRIKQSKSKIKNGEQGIRRIQISMYKTNSCIFGCTGNKKYLLHHNPPITKENARRWEGYLFNVCQSCHEKIHNGSLHISDEYGIFWGDRQYIKW